MALQHWPDRLDNCRPQDQPKPASFAGYEIPDLERLKIKARAAALVYTLLAVYWAGVYALFILLVTLGGRPIYLVIFASVPWFVSYCHEAKTHVQRDRELQAWCDLTEPPPHG